jgi:nucleoside-diphosphate-sugar epimerase
LKILVTGVTGMVGRAVVARLLASGHRVVGAVRNLTLPSEWPEVQQVRLDLDHEEVLDWRNAGEVECIIHLAGRVHVMHQSSDDRNKFNQENTDATRSLAKIALERGVRRFVYASTVKVNGELTSRPFRADDLPNPMDDYAKSKFATEQALHGLLGGTRMELAIVRPTLVYGPYVRGNFRALMRLVQWGIPLPLGSVTNSRSLVNVWNLADFLQTLATAHLPDSRVWMVSDGEDLSTPGLITKLAHAFGRRPRLFHVPFSMLEAAAAMSGRKPALYRLAGSLQVDISRSLADLPWRPAVSVDEGIRRTVEWFLARSRN